MHTYTVGYAKNENTTVTMSITGVLDASSVPGYVVFWDSSSNLLYIFNKDNFVYAYKTA